MNERTDHAGRAFALLVSANPVELEDIRRELDEKRLATARAHAYATLETPHSVVERLAAAHSPRAARRVGLLGAAAAATAAVTVALAGLVPGLPGSGERATGLRVLNAAASIAAAQPATAPGPGEYTYVKQRLGIVGGPSGTVEWWIASDGSGRMHRSGAHTIGVWAMTQEGGRGERRVFVEGHDRTARDATFGPGRFAEFYEKVNPGVLDGRIDELPTDPETLKAVLLHRLREAPDFNPDPATESLQMLQLLEEVLANPLAPPKLRGAVYDIAAGLEGVEIREHVADPAGRTATAIALCSDAIPARYEVFFDPATSATLGTREVDSVPCDDAGLHGSGLGSYSVYLEQATVDSIHRRP
jgi:hypothetical protein